MVRSDAPVRFISQRVKRFLLYGASVFLLSTAVAVPSAEAQGDFLPGVPSWGQPAFRRLP